MNSVAIATLVDSNNFGNRLQNFALQEALYSLGCARVDTIVSVPGTHNGYPPLQRGYHLMRAQGGLVLRTSLGQVLKRTVPSLGAENSPLLRFSESYVHLVGTGYTDVAHPGIDADSYDRFIVGSDQVWNPVFGLPVGLDFLRFAREDQRVAYAASFGVDAVPRRLRSRYRTGICGIPRLSVREGQGQAIVHDLTGRDATRVVDPTLLHEESFWLAFAKGSPSVARGNYAAAVLLGARGSIEALSALQGARAQGLDVVDLLRGGQVGDSFGRSPQEFLSLIAGADLVISDSFHASLFALLFGKPLCFLGRPGMNSRLSTLFELVGVPSPDAARGGGIGVIAPDRGQVLERLSAARRESLDYLADSVG